MTNPSNGVAHLSTDASHLYKVCIDALAEVYLAAHSFVQSCKNPYVLDVVKRTSKTVLVTAACHYVLLTAILWPLRLLCGLLYFLSFTLINLDVSALVTGSMAVYPLMTLLLIRYVYRSQMEQCFFHTLTELDPKYASSLEGRPRTYKATTTQKILKQLGITGEDSEDLRVMLVLMAAGMLLRGWRSMPYVGFIIAPILQFLSIRYMVGHPMTAAAFSLLAAVHPSLERPVMNFVELWASSKVLGASSMRFFFERCVPRNERAAFVRTSEFAFVSYFLLPTALLRVPLLGSLVAFPSAALAAYALEDILSRQPSLRHSVGHVE